MQPNLYSIKAQKPSIDFVDHKTTKHLTVLNLSNLPICLSCDRLDKGEKHVDPPQWKYFWVHCSQNMA